MLFLRWSVVFSFLRFNRDRIGERKRNSGILLPKQESLEVVNNLECKFQTNNEQEPRIHNTAGDKRQISIFHKLRFKIDYI